MVGWSVGLFVGSQKLPGPPPGLAGVEGPLAIRSDPRRAHSEEAIRSSCERTGLPPGAEQTDRVPRRVSLDLEPRFGPMDFVAAWRFWAEIVCRDGHFGLSPLRAVSASILFTGLFVTEKFWDIKFSHFEGRGFLPLFVAFHVECTP